MICISKKWLRIILLVFIALICTTIYSYSVKEKSIVANAPKKAYIALVIDDAGSHGDGVDELLKLNIPITAAVMPFLEYSQKDAQDCFDAGIEVILHLPMESETGLASWLGPKPIKCSMSDEEIRATVLEGLEEVKWAKGMNNHMGSKAIKDKRVMQQILEIAKENGLFFLDSKTISSDIAKEVSSEMNVAYLSRDVFLDNSKKEKEIEDAMIKLEKIALQKGYAIGIGHVGGQGGKVTINTINKMAEELKKNGIEFIYLSELDSILNGYERARE
jgi:hypothetical protein